MARLANPGRSPSPTKRAIMAAPQPNNPPEGQNPFQTQSKIRRSVPGAPSSLQPTVEEDEDELQLTDTRVRRTRFELGCSDKEYTHNHEPTGHSYTEKEEKKQNQEPKGIYTESHAQVEGPTALSRDKAPELSMRTPAGLGSQLRKPQWVPAEQLQRVQEELVREQQLRRELQRASISAPPSERIITHDRYAKEPRGLDIIL